MEPNFINKAENKFAFAAFCLNLRKLDKDPNFLVRMLVFLNDTWYLSFSI